ncbi:MAG: permease prefix domain 2-containing transporter [Bacteroidia bacterium]|nr:permease prefix domain 2-containing transporter [Bacteroidia bacterium]
MNSLPQPPRWALRFLHWYCHPAFLEEIEGDLYELFYRRVEETGTHRARWRFVWDVIRFFRLRILRKFTLFIHTAMWQNHFKIAFRNMQRQKTFTVINILGLTVGITTAMFMLLWVSDEWSFDRFHSNSDNIYRVYTNMAFGDGELVTWGTVPQPLEKVLREEYPEISHVVLMGTSRAANFALEGKVFKEEGLYGGKEMFEVFSYELLEGDPANVLKDLKSLAISEDLARKYFGENWKGNTLGKTIRINNNRDVTVTGVFANVPDNSSLKFDFVLSVEDLVENQPWQKEWGNFNFWMYVMLKQNTDGNLASVNIQEAINRHYPEAEASLFLHPLTKEHLYSQFENGKSVGGKISYVRIFSVVAFFLILIACINFMNLATARSVKRAKEIGVRKVIGATRSSLISQFMSESVLTVMISMLAVILAMELLMPFFNSLTGKNLAINYASPEYWLIFWGIALFAGVLSGSYPSFFLSSFQIVKILKGTLKFGKEAVWIRMGLVVFQFSLSILLIIGALVVSQQINFLKNQNLGLDKDNMVFFGHSQNMNANFPALKEKMLAVPGVTFISISDQNPLMVQNSTSSPVWQGKDPNLEMYFHVIKVNEDFLGNMHINLASGRNFSTDYSLDSANYLINETSAKAMGLTEPLDKELEVWGRKGRIIGVIKDFHITSLHTPIEPVILTLRPEDCGFMFARIAPGKIETALSGLTQIYKEYNANLPMDYRFMDDTYQQYYESETVMGKLAHYFAGIAIFIACLGLLGLASFSAQQRTREIGIRKVLGASVPHLVMLMSREFILLVGVAFLIAVVGGLWLTNQWLSEYAYRTEPGIEIFVIAGVISVAVAWLTILFQALRAASANPVEAIRTE